MLTPNSVRERLAALTASARHATLVEICRELGKQDFWFFCTVILANPVLQEDFHRPICDWLSKDWTRKKKLFLAPRGHIKSNLGTVAHALWCIVRNPNIRILIGSHKLEDASKFLNVIKTYIRSERFKMFYPEICPAMNATTGQEACWQQAKILVQRTAVLVENTVECSSSDAMVTGRHYDRFYFDDLVTHDNVTETGLTEVADFHKFCEPMLEPGGEELVTGTRYHFSDEYGRILDTQDLRSLYSVMDVSAFAEVNENPGMDYDIDWLMAHGRPVYGKRFTTALNPESTPGEENKISLLRLYRNSGPWVFNTQYMNRPQDPKTQRFKREDLDRMWIDALPNEPLQWFRVCDLSTDKPTNDSFTAIVTGGVDARSTIYITDIIRCAWDGYEVIKELFRGQEEPPDEMKPIFIGMERMNYETAIRSFVRRESMHKGTWLPIKQLPGKQQQKSKDDRIGGLDSWVAGGAIKILRTCRNGQRLYDELLRFPRSLTKDVADATAQIPIFMFPGKASEEIVKGDQSEAMPAHVIERIKNWGQRYIGEDRIVSNPSNIIRLASGF